MTTKTPSFAEQAAQFKGFATNNGEVVDGNKPESRGNALSNDLSEDERAAGVTIAGGREARGAAPVTKTPAASAKVELTDKESDDAVAAMHKTLGLKDDEELTPEEKAEALEAALKTKKTANKGGLTESERVRRAQHGRRSAEARAARAEGRVGDLERRLAALESGGKPAVLTGDKNAPKTGDKEPDAKDFEFGEVDPKYIRALARWEAKQVTAEAEQETKTRQRSSSEEAAAAEYAEKRAAFEDVGFAEYEDFQEVVFDAAALPKSDPASWPMSALIGQLAVESEVGAHVVYALASDPKEARRVDKLTAGQQRLWFARQEAKFSPDEGAKSKADDGEGEGDGDRGTVRRKETEPTIRKTSSAPPPPRRNIGGSSTKAFDPATKDFAAFQAGAQQPVKR